MANTASSTTTPKATPNKSFNVVYNVSKEKAYSDASASLVLLASLNSTVQFSPVLAPNGQITTNGSKTAEYNVQRIKRIKAKDISNPNSGDTADALAALDTFSKVDWVSLKVATGILKGIGVKVGINEKFDVDSIGAGHAKAIADSVNNSVIERHEQIIEEIVSGAQDGGTLSFVKGETKIFDSISDAIEKIELLSDEFKHMTDRSNIVIILHPSVARMVTKEIGTVFNQEAPIYKTGLMSQSSINGVPVIIDPNLNKFQDTDATKRLGAIVMDAEAIAFKAHGDETVANVNLGLTTYVGKYFYNITKLIDEKRVFKLTFDATNGVGQTDKVSK